MPGLVSPDLLEQIRAASDIVDVISGYIPLKRAGANFSALCPFHREKTPSFTVTPHKQIFYCFGCHKGGDVFRFVQTYENLTFPEALKRLAERAKIPLTFQGDAIDQGAALKEKLFEIQEQAAQRWHGILLKEPAAEPARQYLSQRKVGGEAIKLFRLGYAPDSWDDTVSWLARKGYDPGVALKSGLVAARDGESGYYDRFRGRVIFPISNEQGRVIGFSGRLLAADAKAAKYINSPETPIFNKGRVFFGLDKSKRALIESQSAVVLEGQVDLITAYLAGIKNVVAPQGTAFTDDHARILKRYVEEVVLCFDSDAAGQNASVRALDALLAAGLPVRVATIPAPHDPDSYIKQLGGEAFRSLLAEAVPFFDFYLNNLCSAHDPRSSRGKSLIVAEMAEKLGRANNAVWLDQYAQKTAMRLEVAPEAVRAEFKKLVRGGGASAREETEEAAAPAPVRPSPTEFWLLKLLLLHDDLIQIAVEFLQLDWVEHELVRNLLRRRLEAERGHSWAGLAAFIGELEPEQGATLAAEAASENRTIPNPSQQIHDCLRKLRDRFLEKEMIRVVQRASDPAIAPGERRRLLERQKELIGIKGKPVCVP